VRRTLAHHVQPRSVAAVLAALAIAAGLDLLLRDWAHSDALLVALGILLAAVAGAVGGVVAGVAAGAGGWALFWFLVSDRSLPALLAVAAWVATGAVAGWIAMRLRSAASEREREVGAAREQLSDSEARFRALTQSVPVVTYVCVPGQAGRRFASDRVERLTGYSAEDFRRDPDLYARLVHGDDRDHVQLDPPPDAEPDEPFRSEYRLLTRDGRVVWLEDEAVTVRDGEGRTLCVQGWLLDVSERRLMDEDRRQLRPRRQLRTPPPPSGTARPTSSRRRPRCSRRTTRSRRFRESLPWPSATSSTGASSTGWSTMRP
jgi:PAS domain S-box-containing protein